MHNLFGLLLAFGLQVGQKAGGRPVCCVVVNSHPHIVQILSFVVGIVLSSGCK